RCAAREVARLHLHTYGPDCVYLTLSGRNARQFYRFSPGTASSRASRPGFSGRTNPPGIQLGSTRRALLDVMADRARSRKRRLAGSAIPYPGATPHTAKSTL